MIVQLTEALPNEIPAGTIDSAHETKTVCNTSNAQAIDSSTGLTETGNTTSKRRAKASTGKTELVLKQLRSKRGATAASLMEATGWQAHSVRGFLSGTVRKKLRLNLNSEVGKDGQRRYRLTEVNSIEGAL
jgi:hypothetical protein